MDDTGTFACPDCDEEEFAGPRYLSAHIIREHRGPVDPVGRALLLGEETP